MGSMEGQIVEYKDDFNTCKETFVTFRIIHEALNPEEITGKFQLAPSDSWRKGEPKEWKGRAARTGMWVLSTENRVLSRDLRRHLDWIIEHVQDKSLVLDDLRTQGYHIDVFCHWVQLGGTGGPILSPRNMEGMSRLSLEISFEFWSEPETDDEEESAGDDENECTDQEGSSDRA